MSSDLQHLGFTYIDAKKALDAAKGAIFKIDTTRDKENEKKILARMEKGKGLWRWHRKLTREEAVEYLDDEFWNWRSSYGWRVRGTLVGIQSLATVAIENNQHRILVDDEACRVYLNWR